MEHFGTSRLIARDWTVADVAPAFAIYGQAEVARWLGAQPRTPVGSLEEMAQVLDRRIARSVAEPDYGLWPVQLRSTGEIVGAVLLAKLPGPGPGPGFEVEIGWHLNPDHWGHGYATEAGRGVTALAFGLNAMPAKLSDTASALFAEDQVTVTRNDGQFTFGNLPPGDYKLYFNDTLCSFDDGDSGEAIFSDTATPLPFAAQWYKGKLTRATADVIKVTKSKTTTGIDVTLQPPGGFAGTVQNTTQLAVAGECVAAVPQSKDLDPFSTLPPTPETAITGHNGSYSMIDLQPGRYKVEFSTGCGATGLATQWWNGASSESQATVITVNPASTVPGIDATLLHK